MIEPLRIAFDVACNRPHAFSVWTEKASAWWPNERTVSRDPGLQIVFEPRVGGRIFQRAENGREHTWGEITARRGRAWRLGAAWSRDGRLVARTESEWLGRDVASVYRGVCARVMTYQIEKGVKRQW